MLYFSATLLSSPTPSSIFDNGVSRTDATKSKITVAKPIKTWTNSSSKDEMTGKRSAYTISILVKSKKPMSLPYAGVKAWIGVGCDKNSEWAYIGFTESPNLVDTEIEDGYNVIETRFKWDKTVRTVKFVQEWGSKSMHFVNDKEAISKIISSKNATIELNWYGQGSVYFEFPLKGSSIAIQKMRKECATY